MEAKRQLCGWRDCSFVAISREANKLADSLAGYGKNSSCRPTVWTYRNMPSNELRASIAFPHFIDDISQDEGEAPHAIGGATSLPADAPGGSREGISGRDTADTAEGCSM